MAVLGHHSGQDAAPLSRISAIPDGTGCVESQVVDYQNLTVRCRRNWWEDLFYW